MWQTIGGVRQIILLTSNTGHTERRLSSTRAVLEPRVVTRRVNRQQRFGLIRLKPGTAQLSHGLILVPKGRTTLLICCATDYAPAANDEGVLLKPLKQELKAEEIKCVFNYARNLRERYTLGKIIGAGSFGVVREAIDEKSGRRYACKTIPKSPKRSRSTPRYLLKLQSEVDAMIQIGRSLDAVYLKDVYEDNENIHLVMELCEGGSILEGLQKERYSEKTVASIIRSVLRFIAQCHAKGIIYRDIKPDNFLFATENCQSVKATDFGLSIRHWPDEEPLKSRSGTPAYMAPEVVLQEYDQRADLWSIGILMYQLLLGKFPFWENVRKCTLQQVWKAILTERVDLNSPEIVGTVSEPARDLLSRLLQRDPEDRISATDALEHPWVKEDGVARDLPLDGSVVQRLQRFATYGHLKQLVLKMIAEEIENTADGADGSKQQEMIKFRSLFSQLDFVGSGAVAGQDLAEGLRKLGYDIDDGEGEQLLMGLDVNHDGSVTFEEFAACLIDWRQLVENKLWTTWVDIAFSKFDSNGDGYISLDELLQRLPEYDQRAEILTEAKRMLREADTNGDGRISKQEFYDLLVGSSVPDTLMQYDPRIKTVAVDEDLHSMDVISATEG